MIRELKFDPISSTWIYNTGTLSGNWSIMREWNHRDKGTRFSKFQGESVLTWFPFSFKEDPKFRRRKKQGSEDMRLTKVRLCLRGRTWLDILKKEIIDITSAIISNLACRSSSRMSLAMSAIIPLWAKYSPLYCDHFLCQAEKGHSIYRYGFMI